MHSELLRSTLVVVIGTLSVAWGCAGAPDKPADLACFADQSFVRCEEGNRLVVCQDGTLSVSVCDAGCSEDGVSPVCASGPADAESPSREDGGAEEAPGDTNESGPTGCALNNGGCDPLTQCAEGAKGVVCGPCPLGFSGDGQGGCTDACLSCEAPTPFCLEGGGCGACLGDGDCGPGRACDQGTNTCTGCDVFSQTGCADNQVCTLVYSADGESYEGVCSDGVSPSGAPGDYCNPMQCRHGAICQEDLDQLYRCRALCAPEAEPLAMGSCGVDETCIPLTKEVGGVVVEEGLGSCALACDAFSPDSPCPAEMWCVPDHLDPAFERPGTCLPSVGGLEEYAPCAPSFVDPLSTTCAENLLCFGGECRALCDSELAPCPVGGCMDFASADGSYVVLSFCEEACDYDGDVPCEDEGRVCVPATLIDDGAEGGACVNKPADPLWPYAELEPCSETTGLCAPFSYCIKYDGFPGSTGYQCYELCRFSEGPKNTVNHPDCSRKTALCEDILGQALGTTTVGVCGTDIP